MDLFSAVRKSPSLEIRFMARELYSTLFQFSTPKFAVISGFAIWPLRLRLKTVCCRQRNPHDFGRVDCNNRLRIEQAKRRLRKDYNLNEGMSALCDRLQCVACLTDFKFAFCEEDPFYGAQIQRVQWLCCSEGMEIV